MTTLADLFILAERFDDTSNPDEVMALFDEIQTAIDSYISHQSDRTLCKLARKLVTDYMWLDIIEYNSTRNVRSLREAREKLWEALSVLP